MKQQYPRRGHQICQYFVAATEAREDVFYSASIALCCGIIKYSSSYAIVPIDKRLLLSTSIELLHVMGLHQLLHQL